MSRHKRNPLPRVDYLDRVDEARRAKEEGREKVILFNWSGHGLIDLGSYEK